jgi:hypothetical protein
MMADEHAKDKKSLEERIAELDGKLAEKDKVINELTVGNDFASSTFLKDNTTLTPNKARKLYGDHFEVVDGKTVGYDKPAGQTNRTMMVDASGNPLNLDAALKRIVEVDPDKDTLLKAKVNQGSGSSTVIVAKQDQANKPKFATGLDRIRASFDK